MSSSKRISYLTVIGGVVGVVACFLYVFGFLPKEIGGIGLLLGIICSIEFNRNRKNHKNRSSAIATRFSISGGYVLCLTTSLRSTTSTLAMLTSKK